MRKGIILFFLFIFNFPLFSAITSFTIIPDNFTVGDTLTISITADQDGDVSFSINGNPNLISPYTGRVVGGVYQGKHVIFKAGVDSVRAVGSPGDAFSNSYTAYPKPPSRVLILFENQEHLSGDNVRKGRAEISEPKYNVGENVVFTIKLCDEYYNENSDEDTVDVVLHTDDPHAILLNQITFFPGETSKSFSAVFRRATIPYQLSSSDRRHLWGVPQKAGFSGDSVRFAPYSPYFHVQAGPYSKLLILEHWDSLGIDISEQFDPGNEGVGKVNLIKPHPSGADFILEAIACDNYYNRVTNNNLKVVLRFETPLSEGSIVKPDTLNLKDGRDTFILNISSSGIYSCYLFDTEGGIQSSREILDIRGSFYVLSVDPDTILASTQLFRFIVSYYDASNNQTNASHNIYIKPVLESDRSKRASGFLSDSVFRLNQGIVDVWLRYSTQSNEVISLRVTDEIGTQPAYSEPIYVNYFPAFKDTFLVYPNPFGSVQYGGVKYDRMQIMFYLPEPSDAEVFIYDMFGRPVRKFKLNVLSAGKHMVTWDGTNDNGKRVASGAYILILNAVKGARTIYNKKKIISVIW